MTKLFRLAACVAFVVASVAVVQSPASAASGCASNSAGLVCIIPSSGGSANGWVYYSSALVSFRPTYDGTQVCNFRGSASGQNVDGSWFVKMSPIQYYCRTGYADVRIYMDRQVIDPSFTYGQFTNWLSWTGAVARGMVTS